MEYTGIKDIELNSEELAQFYQGDYPIRDLLENQYVFIRDGTDKIVDKSITVEKFADGIDFDTKFTTETMA